MSSEGLAVTQKDKLGNLQRMLSLIVKTTYREKLVTLRNSYFPTNGTGCSKETKSETYLKVQKQVIKQPAVTG